MKFFSALLSALCLVIFPGPARAASINGQNYVALADWARGNGFYGYTLNRGDEIVLTNRTTRLVFEKDSHDAEINGVNVRLSYAVAKGALISQLDLDKTVRPLIFAQKPSPKKITTICLDPGHGGKDTGYRIWRYLLPHDEKTYTLALALELRKQLQAAGFNVVLTRDRDIFPTLAERSDIANRRGADLFVALHFNCTTNQPQNVQGPETYCMTPAGAASSNDSLGVSAGSRAYPANRFEDKSLLLAYQMQKSLVKNLGATDRSVRRARYEVLREAEMPAILIEGGYMSHPVEGKKIFDPAYRKQMASAIVKGILSYQKLTAPAVLPSAPVTNKVSKVKSAR